MQDTAYDAMRQMQERHWWWRGMRRLYRTALTRFLPPAVPQNKRRVIDVGCGFGANLPVLQPLGDLVCVDVSPEALQTIDSTAVLGRVQAAADALPDGGRQGDLCGLPIGGWRFGASRAAATRRSIQSAARHTWHTWRRRQPAGRVFGTALTAAIWTAPHKPRPNRRRANWPGNPQYVHYTYHKAFDARPPADEARQ